MKREISNITGFIKVTADDGMVLTFYKDEEPIENYVGIKIVHTNREESLENLREITFGTLLIKACISAEVVNLDGTYVKSIVPAIHNTLDQSGRTNSGAIPVPNPPSLII